MGAGGQQPPNLLPGWAVSLAQYELARAELDRLRAALAQAEADSAAAAATAVAPIASSAPMPPSPCGGGGLAGVPARMPPGAILTRRSPRAAGASKRPRTGGYAYGDAAEPPAAPAPAAERSLLGLLRRVKITRVRRFLSR